MGNHRVLLYFTLFFIVYMIWAQWQEGTSHGIVASMSVIVVAITSVLAIVSRMPFFNRLNR